jgi:23S rRNA (uracil1939-C5)-methyltransferase
MSTVCKHFGDCGGCSFQDIPYLEQLCKKEEEIKRLLREAEFEVLLKPINHYPEWFYRNKMEFCFYDNGDGKTVCGLYSKKFKNKVTDLEECLIFSPDIGIILAAVKDFVKAGNYPAYNKYNYKGFLRHLVVREAKFTSQIMVGLVTTGQAAFDRAGFVKLLAGLKLNSSIKSIYHILNDSMSDAVIFQEKNLLYGEPFIREELGGFQFNIGIDTFFQVNPRAIDDFYAKIRGYAGLDKTKSVLDLFCGTGSIGMFLAKDAKYVWGVEIEKAIVEAAWENAKINNINNISFAVSDTKNFLNTQSYFHQGVDLLIVNPPRCGVSPKVVKSLLTLNAKRIIYSSCNPKSLFEDLKLMCQFYRLEFVEPFDFFPHTPHCECLTILNKI